MDQFDEERVALGADKVDNFLAAFGLGPKYKPKPRKTFQCPRCEHAKAYYKEIHADTDMNDIVLVCPACGYSALSY